MQALCVGRYFLDHAFDITVTDLRVQVSTASDWRFFIRRTDSCTCRDMRRLPLVLAALTFQACIGVQEFGDSWAKGTVDPALEGTWTRVEAPGETREWAGPEKMTFTRAGDRYLLDSHDDEAALPTKTLRVGSGRLLMIRGTPKGEDAPRPTVPMQGMLMRYEVSDGLLREFFPELDRIEALLRSRFRAASGIGTS